MAAALLALLGTGPAAAAAAEPQAAAEAGSGQAVVGDPRSWAAARWATLSTPGFDTLGRRDGVPHPIVMALAEDAAGFLWIGTQGGLARYDGYRVHSYGPDPERPGSLPGAYVFVLHRDAGGRLWVGTIGTGAAWYDPDGDRFVPLPVGAGGLPSATVMAIADDGEGGLWFGTQNGLAHRPAAGDRLTVLGTGPAGGLPDGSVIGLLRDHDGTLWIGTHGGLARLARGADRAEPFRPDGFPAGAARPLGRDGRGRLWFASIGADLRLWVMDPASGALRQQTDSGGAPLRLPAEDVTGLVETAPDQLLLGLNRGGVAALDTVSGTVAIHAHDAADPQSLPHSTVFTLHRDRSGLVWIGTRNGVARHNPGTQGIVSIRHSPFAPDRISDPDVLYVTTLASGELLLGLSQNGVDRIDPVRGRVGGIRPGQDGFPQTRVYSLLEDADGVLVGTAAGLWHQDRGTGALRSIPLPPDRPDVRSMAFWRDRLLIGTRSGLAVLEPGATAAVPFTCGAEPSYSGYLVSVQPGPDNRLWLATLTGIDRLDPESCAIDPLTHDPARADSLPSGLVTALRFMADGRLWVGTLGGGIGVGRLVDGAWRFRRLTMRDGLPSNSIGALEVDRNGRIWASTADGLASVDPESLEVQAYGPAEGVTIPAYWGRSGTVTEAGEIVFGGGGGLTVVRPDRVTPWTYQPPMVVTAVRVGGEDISITPFNRPDGNALLVVPPRAKGFELAFADLDYAAPARVRYRYRLEGYDEEWLVGDAGRRVAAYTNLPPGDYRLLVEGTNKDGLWSPHRLAIPVRILPDWYQQRWLQAVAGLAGLILLAGLVQLRTDGLRRRQLRLEAEIANRTAELVQANGKLEQLANTDPLTGVLNRRRFQECAEEERVRSLRYRRSLALLLIDLDHFKQINDSFGHAVGDMVLQEAVTAIRRCLRQPDLVGRLGGEEFTVLLPETDAAGARALAERLRETIARHPIRQGDRVLSVTASIGLAVLAGPEDGLTGLVRRADLAMYEAKSLGRNRVVEAPAPVGAPGCS